MTCCVSARVRAASFEQHVEVTWLKIGEPKWRYYCRRSWGATSRSDHFNFRCSITATFAAIGRGIGIAAPFANGAGVTRVSPAHDYCCARCTRRRCHTGTGGRGDRAARVADHSRPSKVLRIHGWRALLRSRSRASWCASRCASWRNARHTSWRRETRCATRSVVTRIRPRRGHWRVHLLDSPQVVLLHHVIARKPSRVEIALRRARGSAVARPTPPTAGIPLLHCD